MCLAVPGKLVECQDQEAVVDMHGNRLRVSTILVPELVVGDWVLVHAGFVIQRLDEQEAAETWAILRDVERAQEATLNEEKGRST
jgi:hydrogenase expression/formation protein HypC